MLGQTWSQTGSLFYWGHFYWGHSGMECSTPFSAHNTYSRRALARNPKMVPGRSRSPHFPKSMQISGPVFSNESSRLGRFSTAAMGHLLTLSLSLIDRQLCEVNRKIRRVSAETFLECTLTSARTGVSAETPARPSAYDATAEVSSLPGRTSTHGQIRPVRHCAILGLAKHLRGRHLSGIANPEVKPKSVSHPDSIQASG